MTTENKTETNLDKVVARVRKMLALANDAAATEGERDNALRMAHATLAKHNLDMATVEASGQTPSEKREHVSDVEYGYPWAKQAAQAVGFLYFCKYFYSKHPSRSDLVYHKFVGKTSNVTTAREIAVFVIRSILKEANARKSAERQSWAWHTSFCKGASASIVKRCAQLRRDAEGESVKASTGTALVLASVYQLELKANEDFLAAIGTKLKSRASHQKRAETEGFNSGKAFGDRVSLNR